MVKKLLRKHGYPPDAEKTATETVLAQAERLGDTLVEDGEVIESAPPERPFRVVPPEEVQPFEKRCRSTSWPQRPGGSAASSGWPRSRGRRRLVLG